MVPLLCSRYVGLIKKSSCETIVNTLISQFHTYILTSQLVVILALDVDYGYSSILIIYGQDCK